MTDAKEMDKEFLPYMVVRLGGRRYVCDFLNVQEIVGSPEIEPSFDGTEFLIGLFDSVRGVLPALDLLSRPPDICPIKDMSLVILEASGQLISLLVDELLDVVRFDPGSVLPLPEGANGIPDELLSGVIEIDDTDYYLLNLDQIISVWQSTVFGKRAEAGDSVTDQ
jgi:chemotaxis signal transduction protein